MLFASRASPLPLHRPYDQTPSPRMACDSYSQPPSKRMAFSAPSRYNDTYAHEPIHSIDDSWGLSFESPSRVPYLEATQPESLTMPAPVHRGSIHSSSYSDDGESAMRHQPHLQVSIPTMPKADGLPTPLSAASSVPIQPRDSSIPRGMTPVNARAPIRSKTFRGIKGTDKKLEPTWKGFIGSTYEALQLLEACLNGDLHHMPRRAYDREREEVIKSGHVFVFEENASGIKRWTDGVAWSPSRLLPNFLIYREVEAKDHQPGEKKRAIKKRKRSVDDEGNDCDGYSSDSGAPIINPNDIALTIPEPERRKLCGSLTDSYNFKSDGLVKKTISVEYKGNVHHIIAYYNLEDVLYGQLPQCRDDPILKNTVPRMDLLNFHKFQGNPDNPMDDPMRLFNAPQYWAPHMVNNSCALIPHVSAGPVPASSLSYYSPSHHQQGDFWAPQQPTGPWSQQTPQIQTFNPTLANVQSYHHPHPHHHAQHHHNRHDSGTHVPHPITPMTPVSYANASVSPIAHFQSPYAMPPPVYHETFIQS